MRIVWVAAMAAVLAGAPAYAEEFVVPVDVPSGSVIEVIIEKNGEHTEQGQTTQIGDMTFRYRQDVVATDEGYAVTQTALSMEGPPEAKASLDAAMATTKVIAFDTDGTLTPVRVRDVDALLAAITKSDGATPEQLKAQEDAVAMFKRTTPEHLAGVLLREQAMAAAFQGMALPAGVEVEAEAESPNPFGSGPAVRKVLTAMVTSIDRDRGLAVIETNDEIDVESFKAALPAMAREMNAPPPSAEDLAQITVEQSRTCRYEIDLQSGLAALTQCQEIKGSGDKNGSKRTVTNTQITQKLIRPAA